MIYDIIGRAAFFIGIMILSILLHEWGHVITWSIIKKKKITLRYRKGEILCGKVGEYKELTNEQYEMIVVAGILLGCVPLIAVGIINFNLHFLEYITLWGLYFAGCRTDLKGLYELKKKSKD